MTWQLVGNLSAKPGNEPGIAELQAEVLRLSDELSGVTKAISSVVSKDETAQLVKAAVDALQLKDGVGLTGAVIDRNGHLVLTLSDGTAKDVGQVVGKDADAAEIERLVADAVAKIPVPKDGEIGPPGPRGEMGPPGEVVHGKDGQDGITMDVDDLQAVDYDGERTVTLKFQRGERVKEFPIKLATFIDRGVYDPQKTYEPGDTVTLGGSLWIAKTETNARPGTNDGAAKWRLAAKAGRDGREGKPGPVGPVGPRGEKGMDGRNGYAQ